MGQELIEYVEQVACLGAAEASYRSFDLRFVSDKAKSCCYRKNQRKRRKTENSISFSASLVA